MINEEDFKASKKGEKLFMQLLDRLKLAFLYIRQEKDHVSNSLKNHQDTCNPDFQVHLRGLGNPYIDVKVRRIFYLNPDKNVEDEKSFRLNNDGKSNGINELVAFQRLWLAPLWIAFIDRKIVDADKPGMFYLISIDTIKAYHHALKTKLSQERLDNLPFLCLPLKLMQVVNDKTKFSLNTNFPESADIEAWAEKYSVALKNEKS